VSVISGRAGKTGPRVLLISLRDPVDPMAAHERRCFAVCSALDEEAVAVHAMTDGPPPRWKLQEYDALLFGGSGAYSVLDDVIWIRQALDVLVDVVELGVPSWASCFGFQGLAMALGGAVEHDEERAEMGSTELSVTPAGERDGLFRSLPVRFWAQQGHHDRVTVLPPGVERLATGDVCREQAFKVGGAPFWASQFHPELTVASTLDRFHHYRDHYLDDASADGVFQKLQSGRDTPEVGQLVARLVRHQFN
jgi:GMP synthase (glutamine-hydrolysing)